MRMGTAYSPDDSERTSAGSAIRRDEEATGSAAAATRLTKPTSAARSE